MSDNKISQINDSYEISRLIVQDIVRLKEKRRNRIKEQLKTFDIEQKELKYLIKPDTFNERLKHYITVFDNEKKEISKKIRNQEIIIIILILINVIGVVITYYLKNFIPIIVTLVPSILGDIKPFIKVSKEYSPKDLKNIKKILKYLGIISKVVKEDPNKKAKFETFLEKYVPEAEAVESENFGKFLKKLKNLFEPNNNNLKKQEIN